MEELKVATIKSTFDGLSLEAKRKLIFELLKSARIVHGLCIDPIEPKFKVWLCRGEKKFFTEEEAEKVWKIWTYVKMLACHSQVDSGDSWETPYNVISIFTTDHHDYHISCDFAIETFDHNNKNGKRQKYPDEPDIEVKCLAKDAYFDWLLDNTIPEQVQLCQFDYGPNYNFPNLSCSGEFCDCNMEPVGMKKEHYWDIDLVCPNNK